MSIRNLFLLSFMLTAIVGCSSDVFLVHNGNMPAEDKISQIRIGQDKSQVEAILGSPSSVATFDENTWIYMSSTLKKVAFFEPEEVNRDVLTIRFNAQNQVSEISEYDRNNGVEVTIESAETPVEGHDVGFFRKYFGGVGTYLPIAPSGGSDGL